MLSARRPQANRNSAMFQLLRRLLQVASVGGMMVVMALVHRLAPIVPVTWWSAVVGTALAMVLGYILGKMDRLSQPSSAKESKVEAPSLPPVPQVDYLIKARRSVYPRDFTGKPYGILYLHEVCIYGETTWLWVVGDDNVNCHKSIKRTELSDVMAQFDLTTVTIVLTSFQANQCRSHPYSRCLTQQGGHPRIRRRSLGTLWCLAVKPNNSLKT